MKVAICLLIKDENEYLDEWLNHHRAIGFSRFYIYDNHSKIPVNATLWPDLDCVVKLWDDYGTATQVKAYEDCCRTHPDNDFILFIDADEFVMINHYLFKTIDQVIRYLKHSNGEFQALGIYWRMYGKTSPYFEIRQPVTEYVQYSKNKHIKTMVKPSAMKAFLDPHHCSVAGKYVDEIGIPVKGPFSDFHTSSLVWIKHIWTRSFAEFQQKILRGSGDKVDRNYDMTHFYEYNDGCTLKDDQ